MTIIDSKNVGTVDGFDITVVLVPNKNPSPDDFECYNSRQIAAWKRDDWSYVGTIITASRAGVELGSSSLWGSEYGLLPGVRGWVSPLNGTGDDFVNGYGPQLIAEAVAQAQVKITELQK